MEITLTSRPIIRLTQAEYLKLDRQSELRHEFLAGEVFVVTGASRNHNLITFNEVLSKSTEAYDRGLKFELYRGLESLQEFILIAQNKCHVEHYRRQSDNRWILTETNDPAGLVALESIAGQLAVEQIYLKVALDLSGSAEIEG
jgi:hypothetical protein